MYVYSLGGALTRELLEGERSIPRLSRRYKCFHRCNFLSRYYDGRKRSESREQAFTNSTARASAS